MPDEKVELLRLDSRELKAVTDSVFHKGNAITFKAGGSSMWPFIRDMDTVTLVPVAQVKFGLGDIVGFLHPASGNFLVHRVVKLRNESVQIKGDNRLFSDGWIKKDKITGVLYGISRHDRSAYSWLRLKKIIAVLSRHNLLIPIIKPAVAVVRRSRLLK